MDFQQGFYENGQRNGLGISIFDDDKLDIGIWKENALIRANFPYSNRRKPIKSSIFTQYFKKSPSFKNNRFWIVSGGLDFTTFLESVKLNFSICKSSAGSLQYRIETRRKSFSIIPYGQRIIEKF